MAIVATEHGGLIPCPGGPHAHSSGARRAPSLGPGRGHPGAASRRSIPMTRRSRLAGSSSSRTRTTTRTDKRHQLHCYAISAKRYTFYVQTPMAPELVKPSEHGLGHLLNPTDPDSDEHDWIADRGSGCSADTSGYRAPEPSGSVCPRLGASPSQARTCTASSPNSTMNRSYARADQAVQFPAHRVRPSPRTPGRRHSKSSSSPHTQRPRR